MVLKEKRQGSNNMPPASWTHLHPKRLLGTVAIVNNRFQVALFTERSVTFFTPI